MKFKENIQKLLVEALSLQPDLFLIDLHIDDQSRVQVVLDGDNGVSLEQCIKVSRHIEHQLDREVHDFSLEVSSAGATHPLQMVDVRPVFVIALHCHGLPQHRHFLRCPHVAQAVFCSTLNPTRRLKKGGANGDT